jgi:replicative DNA helicase
MSDNLFDDDIFGEDIFGKDSPAEEVPQNTSSSKDLEFKLINWMLRGPIEILDIYRSIEPSLLFESFSLKNKAVLKIVQDYYSQYKTPPSKEILKSLSSNAQTLSDIFSASCTSNEIPFFIDQHKKSFNKKLADDLKALISANKDNLSVINESIKNSLVKIEKLGKDAIFSEGNFTNSVDERYNDYLYTVANPNNVMGVFSGYKALDEYTWGIKNSEMMVISGATSSGKSLIMMNMAINAWLGSNNPGLFDGSYFEDGKNVVYVTLEMSKKQLEQRIDANIANIRHRAIMRGQLTPEEITAWRKSLQFQRNYDKKFHIIDMPRGTKAVEIEAKYDAILGQFKPDLICVDYLGIMKPNTSHGSDWQDIGHIAEDLHEFCRKKNIPLITAAQRKGRIRTAGKNKAETVEDSEEIGRSKMIGDNANIILLIENRSEEHLREDMNIHITKNRDGAKGKVTLLKDFEKSKVISAPEDWTADEGLENEV